MLLGIIDDDEDGVQQMVSVAGICRLGKPGKQSGDLFSAPAFLLKHTNTTLQNLVGTFPFKHAAEFSC